VAKVTDPVPGPAPLIEPEVVPVFLTIKTHELAGMLAAATPSIGAAAAVWAQTTEADEIDSVAGLADVPKMPNTNVAMATAAIRVMAISMTVARTGLIALRLDGILMLLISYGRMVVNARLGPLPCVRNPVTAAPEVYPATATETYTLPLAGTEQLAPRAAPLAAAAVAPQATPPAPKLMVAPLAALGPAPLMDPDTVPVLETCITQPALPAPRAAALQTTLLAGIESVAGLALVPKIPNTKVAIATAAISVIAMRMTVASTGEMAFLFFL